MSRPVDFTYTLVDLVDNSTVLTGKRAILRGIHVKETVGANDVPIKAGSTQVGTIPSGAFVGQWFPFGDMEIDNLTIDPADAETAGELLVVYKEYQP